MNEVDQRLPDDWADPGAGPDWVSLAAGENGWGKLKVRYAGLAQSGAALDRVFRVVSGQATLALIEHDYIDADYRDEFAHFYAQTFRALPDRCERVHFFDQRNRRYLGFTVLRPIHGRPVCRTVIDPPASMREAVACRPRVTASPYGFRFAVEGFPFISQDFQYGRCAHAAIWMIAYYHHLAYRTPRYFMSDIVLSARAHQDIWRSTPSSGLSFRQITAILHDLKLPAISYDMSRLPEGESAGSITQRYLNSRLPVLLLTPEHATVLVGYGRDDNGALYFVRHDDATGPYLPVGDLTADELGDWEALLVPVPGRIYLPGESAEVHARLVLEQELKRRGEGPILAHLKKGRLRYRTYVTEISEYKRSLRTRELADDVVAWHVRLSASHWVWVTEVQDVAAAARGRRCVLGEIVIDATSDSRHSNQLFANIPGWRLRWAALGAPTTALQSEQKDMYLSGCALHDTGDALMPRLSPARLSRHVRRLLSRWR
jgi:hypothetical protein